MSSSIIKNPDGSATFKVTVWPGLAEAAEMESGLASVPLPEGIALYIGRVIVHCAALEDQVRKLISALSEANSTTLDWQLLSKFRQVLTRLTDEAELLTDLPASINSIAKTVADIRPIHRQRGSIAHGHIYLEVTNHEFHLVADGKHGTTKFTESELRLLALKFCKASFELKAAFDPEAQSVPRSPRETQTLRDFLASNPQIAPTPPTQRPQPRS